MKKIDLSFIYKKEHLAKRIITVLIAVICMGLGLSFLVPCTLGTDPYTFMNLTIANKIGWSLGNWQALFNTAVFIIVIIFGIEKIGFGTVFNMILVGYSYDFFTWIWTRLHILDYFEAQTVRYAVLIPALIFFIIAAATYMNGDLGVSPYDAIPLIVKDHLPKTSFTTIRICYDFLAILIGLLLGGSFQIGTILMALLLGPAVTFVGKKLKF